MKIVYDARQNVSSLKEVTISRSSAQQRRGRAGRTRPGTCFRLYSQDDFNMMSETQTAEVLSQPINLTLLSLFAMDMDPATFPWLEAPDPAASATAIKNLLYLDALVPTEESKGRMRDGRVAFHYKLTEFGSLAAYLQIDPLRARVLYEGHRIGLTESAAELVAVMSTAQNFFSRAKEPEERAEMKRKLVDKVCEEGDLFTMFQFYRGYKSAIATPLTELDTENEKEEAGARVDMGALSEQDSSVDSISHEVSLLAISKMKRPKMNWKLGDAFCEARHMSKRTMTLISKMSYDLLKQMENFFRSTDEEEAKRDLDTSTSSADSDGISQSFCSADVVPLDDRQFWRLVLAGCFLNIAVRTASRGEAEIFKNTSFQHITPGNDNVIVAVVHPSSLLVQYEKAATKFMCFLSMINTSMMFLNSVTVLNFSDVDLIELVREVSPSFAIDMQATLKTVSSEKVK